MKCMGANKSADINVKKNAWKVCRNVFSAIVYITLLNNYKQCTFSENLTFYFCENSYAIYIVLIYLPSTEN